MSNPDMKKRKLTLNRETLTPMQSDELANVNGGTGWFCVSARGIYQSIKVVSNLYSAYEASRAVSNAVSRPGGGGAPRSRAQMTPGGCAD
jgi:hypothetical protein